MWEFFEDPIIVEEGGKKVKKVPCKVCDFLLADGGGTTNLWSHLEALHPEQYQQIHGGTSERSTLKQTTLTGMFRTCSPQCASTITNLIVNFVSRDLRPLNTVEGDGFKQLMNFIEPGYKVPSRTHITNVCHKTYEAAKEHLVATLCDVPSVALTTDIRTSRATQAYITVTVHFITDDWAMESKVLSTQEMPERHTGVHISERLIDISKEWKLYDKVSAVVRDNASNMVLATELIEDWGDLGCFGHTLQLAVNAGLNLNEISRLTAAVKKIVGHFKHSVVAMGALRDRQASMNIPKHSLLQGVSTRWNSTYLMCDRLLEQRWAVYAVIHDEKVTPSNKRYLDLKPDQWDLLAQLVVVLKPLQVATTALCTDLNTSCSLIYPVVNALLTHHLKYKSGELPIVKQFKNVVATELTCRFPFDPSSVAAIATALDPRYHHLKCFTFEQQQEVEQIVEDKIEEIVQVMEVTQQPKQPPKKKETAMSFLFGI